MSTFRALIARCQMLAVMFASTILIFVSQAFALGPFSFQHHYIDRDLPGGSWGQTAAADLDKDGRLDFITGRSRGDIYWYRQTDDGWEKQLLGRDSPSDVGAAVLDVNGDGAQDVLTMSDRNNLRWYDIPSTPRDPWRRTDIGPSVHAAIGAGDFDNDGDLDIVSKLWRPRPDNANRGRNHIDLLENRVRD